MHPVRQLAASLAVLLCGCAGYQLGPTSGQIAGNHSVQVSPCENHTLEPRLGDALTAALRKEFQRDGTFRLATSGPGDLIVAATIQRFERQEVSFLPGDVVTAQDYRAGIVAHVVAKDRQTGKVRLERDFTGNTLMRVGTDLPSIERQTLPLLAQDLARQVVAALADGYW